MTTPEEALAAVSVACIVDVAQRGYDMSGEPSELVLRREVFDGIPHVRLVADQASILLPASAFAILAAGYAPPAPAGEVGELCAKLDALVDKYEAAMVSQNTPDAKLAAMANYGELALGTLRAASATIRALGAERDAASKLANLSKALLDDANEEAARLRADLDAAREARSALDRANDILRGALINARMTFHEYVRLHRAKSPPDEAKAQANFAHADAVGNALARASEAALKEPRDA